MNFFKVMFQPIIKAIHIHYRGPDVLDTNISLLQIKSLTRKHLYYYLWSPKPFKVNQYSILRMEYPKFLVYV